jgi:hypothetical protein
MKNLPTFHLLFAIFFAYSVLASCTTNHPDKQFENPNEIAFIPVPVPDELITVTEMISGQSFYMTGDNISDVTKIQIVGVEHTDEDAKLPGINPSIEAAYNMFWDLYLDSSFVDPDSIRLAMEIGPEVHPDAIIGSMYQTPTPINLINQHMFDKGLRKLIITDPRDKSLESFAIYWKTLKLFTVRGGIMQVKRLDEKGLPVVEITQQPVFSQEDLDWLNSVWYPKCYLADKEFESIVWGLCQNNPNTLGILGAAHAMRLQREYGAKVALIIPQETLIQTSFYLAYNGYYLHVIGKDQK